MLYLLVAANGTVPNAQKAASKAPSQRSITSDAIAARELLGAAASKYGGAAVDEIERLHVTMQGDVFNGLQGYEPSSVESASLTGTTLLEADFDFAGHRRSCQATFISTPLPTSMTAS